jgi:signal transduction histidine kinase
MAHADPAQLDTALLNLALKARDAMPQAGEITIKTRGLTSHPGTPGRWQEGEYLLTTVADTACGMSSAVLSRALQPFFTTPAGSPRQRLGAEHGAQLRPAERWGSVD